VSRVRYRFQQWNIPILNSRRCMHDMDTHGNVSSWGIGCQAAKDINQDLLG
jgi:hypothetical protein